MFILWSFLTTSKTNYEAEWSFAEIGLSLEQNQHGQVQIPEPIKIHLCDVIFELSYFASSIQMHFVPFEKVRLNLSYLG